MQDAGRAIRAHLGQFAAARPGMVARLRLFGLLALLVVLFAGLEYMIGEGMPRVEIRFVSQDVPIFVPVERIVERIVERPVYVPVPADATAAPGTASPTPTAQPGGTPTPSGADPSGAGLPSASAGGTPDATGPGAPGAVPGGLTATGALSSGALPGIMVPGVPQLAPIGAPVSEPGDDLVEPADVGPPAPARGRARPSIVIATEDRLGAPVIVSSGPRTTVRVEREGRQNGNGNENDNQSDGGGQTAQTAASAGVSSAVAPPALRDNSIGVAVSGTETPVKDPIPQKTPRPTFVTAQSVETGQPRTSAIPAPVGVKPPPED